MRIISFLENEKIIKAILDHLGLRLTRSKPPAKAHAPPCEGADILVLGMIMDRGIDGLETHKRIREINPAQEGIIVSGFSETDRVREAQDLGAGAYIKKPYVMEKVGLAIRRELDGT